MEKWLLYSLARGKTDITEVQMRIIGHMQEALQFAADVSRDQVCVMTRGKNPDMAVVLCMMRPAYTGSYAYFQEGDVFFMEEAALAESVFATGRKVVGRKELEVGRQVAVTAYPITDNAGVVFAVVGFISNSLSQQQVLTDTAYMALLLPLADEPYLSPRLQDGLIVLDSVGRILYANDMAAGLCFVLEKEAAEPRNIVGRAMVHLPLVEKIMDEGRPAYGEEKAEGLTLSAWGIPLLAQGKVQRTILVLTDVTAVREKEQQILVKNSVIKEIHHRVKNNLNTIAGILRMQARRASNEETKEALRRAVGRILGISQIHEILARQSGENVDWQELLGRLCRLSLESLTAGSRVKLVLENDETPLIMSSERAVTLAIAVNELIHNAIDHGFRGLPSGTLTISAKREGGSLHICVKNDGHLLPEGFGKDGYDLGLQIVKTLSVVELKGSFRFGNEDGLVTAHIICPLEKLEE